MIITELETPALLLDYGAMQQNMAVMDGILQDSPMKLYPHYKSHKCTQIAKLQTEHGAAGITCAKLSEAEDLAQVGIEKIVLANQVIQYEKLPKLANLARRCRLTVCVDSADNILDLEAACAEEKAMLYVLVEYNVGLHRCGADTFEETLELARLVSEQKHLRFYGIQAYAGHLAHEADAEKRKRLLLEIEEDVRRLKDYLEENGLKVFHVCGGSTGTCMDKPQNTVYTQLQSGSYLFMDSSYEKLNLPFRQALFVLTSVISVRKDRVVVDCGVKSLTMDQRPPYFPAYPDARLDFSEEHTTIFVEDSDLQPGDMIMCVPGHCCTTTNTFDRIHVVDGENVLHVWPVTSRGKAQ